MISPKQRAILQFIGDRQVRKSQIVSRFRSWYYCNASKHLGNILTGMVHRQILSRPKRGWYERGPRCSGKAAPVVAANQLGMFGRPSCLVNCDQGDFKPGGKCDKNGCYAASNNVTTDATN